MLASEIVTAVTGKTLSPDHDSTAILAILNRGLVDIAGGGDRPHGEALVAPLPSLLTSSDVTVLANGSNVAMPTNYQRGLLRATYLGEPLKKYDSFHEFMDAYEGETGTPEGYCLKGNTLWVGPVSSSARVITLYYHKTPTPLVSGAAPSELPSHLQYKLLYNYACREIYSAIEQGIEGHSPDTIKHDIAYHSALTDLERHIGPADGFAVNVGDEYYQDL